MQRDGQIVTQSPKDVRATKPTLHESVSNEVLSLIEGEPPQTVSELHNWMDKNMTGFTPSALDLLKQQYASYGPVDAFTRMISDMQVGCAALFCATRMQRKGTAPQYYLQIEQGPQNKSGVHFEGRILDFAFHNWDYDVAADDLSVKAPSYVQTRDDRRLGEALRTIWFHFFHHHSVPQLCEVANSKQSCVNFIAQKGIVVNTSKPSGQSRNNPLNRCSMLIDSGFSFEGEWWVN